MLKLFKSLRSLVDGAHGAIFMELQTSCKTTSMCVYFYYFIYGLRLIFIYLFAAAKRSNEMNKYKLICMHTVLLSVHCCLSDCVLVHETRHDSA
jgi:hypothetical protein